jgi:hypothetical protein
MSTARDLTGLLGAGRTSPPERTVAAPPPRGAAARHTPVPEPAVPPPHVDHGDEPVGRTRPPRRQPAGKEPVGNRQDFPKARRPATVRISVNIPLASKRWLASQARAQQRFVSEIVMEALDGYGEEASPPSGCAKRVAVPDGTICNIVLPVEARQQFDDVVARKNTTRSALLTEVLSQAADP